MINFELKSGETCIRLGQLLKAAGLAESGVDAKYAIEDGQASVNGEICTMRGKKIRSGDIVSFRGERISII